MLFSKIKHAKTSSNLNIINNIVLIIVIGNIIAIKECL
jgi:hypothetical protein